jgi:Reverse transcriptase (RNA-dependent DNA polymerase)
VVAIDMAKAFDTLSHDFVNHVYKFFRIGHNMIRWLNLIGSHRVACINYGPSNDSQFFNLGQGRPQGDNVSPNSFNFCVQILIFKIELDPGVVPVPRHCPQLINQQNDFFRFESNHETSKNESLADDNTSLTVFERASLACIKNILISFENLSGLACNFDKSCIMPTFVPEAEDIAIVNELNFRIVDSITLLGVEIKWDLSNIREIYAKILTKIINIAAFWERFRLSLSGRIVIAKTFLIAQLNYIACWLPIPVDTLQSIQTQIDNFVTGPLNIAKSRLYLPPDKGGLGLFDLNLFIQAQTCSWIKRANDLCIDNWRYFITTACPGNNILLLRSSDIDPEMNPILFNMAKCYEKFISAFSALDGNYKCTPIFENCNFYYGDNVRLDKKFFGRNLYEANTDIIRNLTFNHCFNNDVFKTQLEFQEMGLNLNLATWMRLRSAILSAKTRLKKVSDVSDRNCTSLNNFLRSFRKGSRKLREVLIHETKVNSKVENLRIVETFAGLTNSIVPDSKTVEACLRSWNNSFFPSDIRGFVFKFRNNLLPLTNRVANFDLNTEPVCISCRILDADTMQRESFAHCFFDCEPVNNIIFRINADLFGTLDPDVIKRGFWYGSYTDTESYADKSINNAVWDIIRFVIFKIKCRKVLPTYDCVLKQALFLINTTIFRNRSYRIHILNNIRYANLVRALG